MQPTERQPDPFDNAEEGDWDELDFVMGDAISQMSSILAFAERPEKLKEFLPALEQAYERAIKFMDQRGHRWRFVQFCEKKVNRNKHGGGPHQPCIRDRDHKGPCQTVNDPPLPFWLANGLPAPHDEEPLWRCACRWEGTNEEARQTLSPCEMHRIWAEEYETREDGERVRRDRWETGIRNIVTILFGPRRKFEIAEVVERVRELHQTSGAGGGTDLREGAASTGIQGIGDVLSDEKSLRKPGKAAVETPTAKVTASGRDTPNTLADRGPEESALKCAEHDCSECARRMYEIESKAALQCGACGLKYGSDYPNEPSIQLRIDGTVRCNDCWAKEAEAAEGALESAGFTSAINEVKLMLVLMERATDEDVFNEGFNAALTELKKRLARVKPRF